MSPPCSPLGSCSKTAPELGRRWPLSWAAGGRFDVPSSLLSSSIRIASILPGSRAGTCADIHGGIGTHTHACICAITCTRTREGHSF